MIKLKLVTRTEQAGMNAQKQLHFQHVTNTDSANAAAPTIMPPMGGSVQLSGFFDADFADSLTVGATYELELTEIVE